MQNQHVMQKKTIVSVWCPVCAVSTLVLINDYYWNRTNEGHVECPHCKIRSRSHGEVTLPFTTYRVTCRNDVQADGEQGKYVLATSKSFENYGQALAYADTVSPSRMPEILVVVDQVF